MRGVESLLILALLGFFLVASGIILLAMSSQPGAESRGVGIILIGPLPIIIDSTDPAGVLGIAGLVVLVLAAVAFLMVRRLRTAEPEAG